LVYRFAENEMGGLMEQNFVAKVIALGRITIPQPVRELLDLKIGDFVEVVVRPIKRDAPGMGAEIGVEKAEEVPVG